MDVRATCRTLIDEIDESGLEETLEALLRIRDFYKHRVPYQPKPVPIQRVSGTITRVTNRPLCPIESDEE